MIEKAQLMDGKAVDRAITRISHEIIERNKGVENLVLVGIKTRGVPIAERICRRIEEIEGTPISIGSIDITHYRDDITEKNEKMVTDGSYKGFDVANRTVI